MKYLFFLLILFVLALLQTSLPLVYLVFLFGFAMFLLENHKFAGLTFFAGGLMIDLLGQQSFGLYAFSYCFVFLGINLARLVLGKNLIASVLILLGAIFAVYSLTLFPSFMIKESLIGVAFYNILAAILLFPLATFANEITKTHKSV